MRKNQASLTAAGIAMSRAFESAKPPSARICYDPYARQMVPGWLYAVMGFFLKTGYAEWRGPGVLGWLAARERYIDDTLQASLQAGLEQLVILGAGYDSRAYRFEALKSSAATIRVFEVDHPATQVDKQDRLVKIFGQVPAHIVFVPVDFNTQSLPTRLSEMGYNPSLKTLFIWQGVSMYLQARAVDETLSFVETCSGTGSAIVFDYIYQSALDGLQKHGEVSNMRRYRFMTGEGLTFGIPQGHAPAYLAERGFKEAKDVGADDLRRLYFTGPNASRSIAGGYGIATAYV